MGEYLIHWGIKGQKWGIRRYQNPDGTLTEEGKRRYGKLASRYRQVYKDNDGKYRYTSSAKFTNTTFKKGEEADLDKLRRDNNRVRMKKKSAMALAGAALGVVALTLVNDYNKSQQKAADEKRAKAAINNYDSMGPSYYDEMAFYENNNPIMDWTDKSGVRHIRR